MSGPKNDAPCEHQWVYDLTIGLALCQKCCAEAKVERVRPDADGVKHVEPGDGFIFEPTTLHALTVDEIEDNLIDDHCSECGCFESECECGDVDQSDPQAMCAFFESKP